MDAWRNPFHVVIEVENRKCRILEKFASIGLKHLKLVDVRSSRGGLVKHLVELDSDQIKKIPKDFIVIPRQRKTNGKHSIWFESEGCDVCNTILARDAFLVSGKNMEGCTIKYSFIVATFEEYKSIISTLEASGRTVTVLKIGSFEPKRGILTEKQQRLFWLALRGGFFDYPRKIGARELSAKLGIKPSTLSEAIRRGTRRLLAYYFEKELV